jgi:two-component system phosphate regulon sensor histidine kinase PhoR
MRKNTIRLVVLMGTISVIGIILIQIYWVRKAFDLKEKQFDQTIQIALRNTAEKLATFGQFSLPNQDLVNQVSTNYYVVNLNNTIDPKALQYYLISEFDNLSIKTDFEYGIYDCSSDKMVYGNYINANKAIENKPLKSLPKLDKFTYYFGVYFPDRSTYITSGMDNWILTTIILLIVIVFFGYAMFIILQQRRLSEVQRDFINNMTHEFKTPLSTIVISSETLADPGIVGTPERLSTYAGIIKEEAVRLNNQVERVLQIARTERQEFKLNKELIDIHALIKSVSASMAINLQSTQGKIILKTEALKHIVNADKQHVTNLIFNLLDNAIKYSNVSPVIIISTRNEGKKLILSVADNGIGIKKEYRKRVFDKFFRVPSGNVHNVKGFGLGLSYVKSIVDAHKWKIHLESELNKGSNFIIEIPITE